MQPESTLTGRNFWYSCGLTISVRSAKGDAMKSALSLSVFLFSAMAFASGCVSQTASTQQAPAAGSDTKVQEGSATKPAATVTAEAHPGLMDPTKAVEKAPEKFQAKVVTTKGDFVIEVTRKWSPNGADRFYNLVKIGYFEEVGIFRAIKGFMFQFGIHGNPDVNKKWGEATINDDPNVPGISNQKGYVTFAKTGRPNSRSTQFFVNLGNNKGLDRQGFTPFGAVVSGQDVLDKINTEYGENPRNENIQANFESQGNPYIKKRFPNIDFIKSVTLVDEK